MYGRTMRWMQGVLAVLGLLAAAGPAGAQVGAPGGAIPPRILDARRVAFMRELERRGGGVAVIRSAEERSIEGDYPQDSDYRENNDFLYLTGIERAESWLVFVAPDTGSAERPRVILYLPPRDSMAERWTGPKLAPGEEARRIVNLTDVRPSTSVEAELRGLVAKHGTPATGGALFLDLKEPLGPESPEFLRALAPNAATASPRETPAVRDVRAITAALRLVKDPDELRRLDLAIDITGEAHRVAMAALEPGMYESELEAWIEFTFRRRGAERVGFPSIVGSGPNAVTLHYDKSRRRMQAGELVVVDIGAEYGYYSADITRTMPVSGTFTPRQRQLYDLVLATQQAAIDSARPGATVADLNRVARAHMRAHSGRLCAPVTCDVYFVHGLSHWLGMDVHDVGDYSRPLAPGMVLTIEPGIYIPAESLGIRIEDDILITEGPARIMSAGAPRTAAAVEAAMARPGPALPTAASAQRP